jgi:hypothetical protein
VVWGPRKIRRGNQPPYYLDGGVTVKGSVSRDATNTGYTDVLQPGKIMVKEASGGLYRPFIIGKSTAAYTDNDTVITVSAATATEIGRLIAVTGGSLSLAFIGPPTAGGTVAETAITVTGVASATTITCGDLNLNKVTDSLIAIPAGGRTAGSFCLIDDDDYTKVTDENGNNINVPLARPLIGGAVDPSKIIDWPADSSTVAYLKGLLNSGVGGYGFTFTSPF